MLKVKLLAEGAKAPTVANPGEDLGFDLYALKDQTLFVYDLNKVRTGIAAEFDVRMPVQKKNPISDQIVVDLVRIPYGLLIRDRSSMAAKGVVVSGGVIDAGYRGEIIVLLSLTTTRVTNPVHISAGDKIAQMIPMPVLTKRGVEVVEELSEAARGDAGFGSTGV